MTDHFDLIVLGTGAAGVGVATRCNRAGWRVAIIDARPYGGTCQLRGCDPKKVLVGAAEALDWVGRLEGKGIAAHDAAIDWPELMAFKRTFVEDVGESNEKWLSGQGIRTYHGKARFTGPATVQAGKETLEGNHIHIAAGAKPAELKISGQEYLKDSTEFLELERLPPRVVFVGGGYISFEFAHIAARTGARATILHRGAHPLAGFDEDLVAILVEKSRQIGIDVRLAAEVQSIARDEGGFKVTAATPEGHRIFHADLVVHGAGRVPDIFELGLEEAGVAYDHHGVEVNEYLQSTTNPSVYAAGDAAATDGPPLTPVAGHEGRVVAENLLTGNRTAISYPAIPSIVFSVPPLARVGQLTGEAEASGTEFETHFARTHSWYSSRRVGEEYTACKVLVARDGGRILGAHLLGPGAEELVNLFTMAINGAMPAPALRDMIFAYPTFGSDLGYMI